MIKPPGFLWMDQGMPNYQDGKIYRLNIGPYHDIGSTCSPLKRRFSQHLTNMHANPTTKKTYMMMMEYVGANYTTNTMMIELLEAFPCNTVEELRAREHHWIRQTIDSPECLNSRGEFQTQEERLQYNKQYRSQVLTCSCGVECTAGNIARHRKSKQHSTESREQTDSLTPLNLL